MSRRAGLPVGRWALAAATIFASAPAAASNGFESPGGGAALLGRGGAWLARADDPLAVYFNPAGMARQPSGVHLGAQLMFRDFCFERRNELGEPVSPGSNLAAPPGESCADVDPFPNPQVAGVYRFHERAAVGLGVAGPHGVANVTWPATVDYPNDFGVEAPHPAPYRYLLLENKSLAFFPTVSGAFAILPNLSVGAGFVWGIFSVDFSQVVEADSSIRGTPQPDEFDRDIQARITGVDAFVPGFVASALWSPTSRIDLAGWYRWSDTVRTEVDVEAHTGFYNSNGTVNEAQLADPLYTTDEPEAGDIEVPIPMEASVGFRYHHPRKGARAQKWREWLGPWARDAMSDDVFDVELDLTWANNSAVDEITVILRPGIPIAQTPGEAPVDGSAPREWRDVLGVRLGGEWVAIPDFLALRAGGFFESKGVDDAYLSTDFHLGERIGVGGGATVRVGPVDILVGYQHTFFGALDNGGQGAVRGLSGAGTTDDRTRQTVNGGSATSSLNEATLGGTFRF